MNRKKDGGPAYPGRVYNTREHYLGMSLRDYFAIHADQPGRLEMSNAAGVLLREHAPKDLPKEERDALPHWSDWFYTLTQKERYQLYAKVRYQMAGVLLEEREKYPLPTTEK
jgi:hypothetical protein